MWAMVSARSSLASTLMLHGTEAPYFPPCPQADFVTEIAFMEDETPAADRIFPVIKSFVDAVAANGLE
eukprot:scaffold1280_cov246-Pinguiococcus_pyrenoidosus.AAC.6